MTSRTKLRVASLLALTTGFYLSACSDPIGTNPIGSGGNVGAGGTASTGGGTGTGGIPGGGGSSAGGGTGTGGMGLGSGGDLIGGGGSPASGGGDGTGGAPPVDPTVLTVQLGEVRQIIRGFGLNATITDGKALPWNDLFTFEGEKALGLSIVRIGMDENGQGRANASGWETVRDNLGGRIIGSCWSAPGDWKTNGMTTQGGHLKPEYYEQWATQIATYAQENGLYAMSVGNETDFASCRDAGKPDGGGVTCAAPLTNEYESMVYTGKELAAFAKVAGPIFDTVAPNVKMITPEASLWIHVWSNLSPTGVGVPDGGYKSSDPLQCNCYSNTIDATVAATCDPKCKNGANGELAEGGYDYGHWLASDPAAWSAFDIMGVHEYESQIAYKWPADVNGGVRDKEVWETEMSGVKYWPEHGPSDTIANGVAVARWMHSALTVGEASAWLYWWYKDYYNTDNEGLALYKSDGDPATTAPRTKRYYTFGNFSRYIRPDVFHAVRVAGPSPDKVLVSAYKGDNGELVIVAINETNAAANVPIAISGGTAPAMMMPIVTSASGNWVEGTPVAVTDGSLPAALPAMSVTTFVSQ